MATNNQYQDDIEAMLATRHDNGGDYWASADGRLGVGNPFSTLTCILLLSEMGVDASNPVLKQATELVLQSWRKDGRFRLAPSGALYPCHTATAARVLCRMGFARDNRLERTFQHLLEIQHTDGGWRCNSFKYGRGPETVFSNPGPTLEVLDAFRFSDYLNQEKALDRAVEFLLDHWVTRKPLGPCHFGIGTQFMKVEYPFFRYNLFFYVYVLSFFNRAKEDIRFLEALGILESRLVNSEVVVENPHRKLAGFKLCRKGEPSDGATARYREILGNLGIRSSMSHREHHRFRMA